MTETITKADIEQIKAYLREIIELLKAIEIHAIG